MPLQEEVMKKEKFSFVKWLTTRDIEKITEKLGLEIMNEPNNPDKKRILKGKDEEGYHITVFCKDLKYYDKDDEYSKITRDISNRFMGIPEFRKLTTAALLAATVLAGASHSGTSFFEANKMVVLKFDDYFLQEQLSMKNEDELNKYDRHLTKEYQKYMSQKFGRHYTDMKRAYYKQLYKEAREEESKQNTETKEETL